MNKYIDVDLATRERLLMLIRETQVIDSPEESSFMQRLWFASGEYARYVFGFMALAFVVMCCMSLDAKGSQADFWLPLTQVAILVLAGIEAYRIRQDHLIKRVIEKLIRRVGTDSTQSKSA